MAANALPTEYVLGPSYPNPFNPSTTITYQLPEPSSVRLTIYDVLGAEIIRLLERTEDAGYKSILFDAAHLSSGMYYYRLEASSLSDPTKTFTSMQKMLLVK